MILSLNFEERIDLLKEMKLKKVRSRECAEHLNISNSAISQYFNGKMDLSNMNEIALIKFVQNYKK